MRFLAFFCVESPESPRKSSNLLDKTSLMVGSTKGVIVWHQPKQCTTIEPPAKSQLVQGCLSHYWGDYTCLFLISDEGNPSKWPATFALSSIPPARPNGSHLMTPAESDQNNYFFLTRCCLGQVPGGAPFSQRSKLATACTNRVTLQMMGRHLTLRETYKTTTLVGRYRSGRSHWRWPHLKSLCNLPQVLQCFKSSNVKPTLLLRKPPPTGVRKATMSSHESMASMVSLAGALWFVSWSASKKASSCKCQKRIN